ncbi:MAG: hypothetical protein ACLR30_03585 [[Clostridium] leptum]
MERWEIPLAREAQRIARWAALLEAGRLTGPVRLLPGTDTLRIKGRPPFRQGQPSGLPDGSYMAPAGSPCGRKA